MKKIVLFFEKIDLKKYTLLCAISVFTILAVFYITVNLDINESQTNDLNVTNPQITEEVFNQRVGGFTDENGVVHECPGRVREESVSCKVN